MFFQKKKKKVLLRETCYNKCYTVNDCIIEDIGSWKVLADLSLLIISFDLICNMSESLTLSWNAEESPTSRNIWGLLFHCHGDFLSQTFSSFGK